MQKVSAYSAYALLKESDCKVAPPLSIIESMASKDSKSKSSGTSSNDGTQVLVHTFTANEDAVIPNDEEIVHVEHDRQMAVTRVVTKRTYDAKQAQADRDAASGPTATPTYPQTAGGVPEPASDPSTSYPWGTLDTTKVQNLEEVEKAGPTIAERESAGKPQENKDETEVATEIQAAANEESAEPDPTPDKPVDSPDENEARAAAQSPAQADLAADLAKDNKSDSKSK